MARKKLHSMISKITQEDAFESVQSALRGPCRSFILERSLRSDAPSEALRRLHKGMSSHTFQTGKEPLGLGPLVAKYDRKTRQEGLHVLQVWHHDTHRFLKGITPVLMLEYVARLGVAAGFERIALAALLDYYFLHVLVLLSTRVWDEGDPDSALDRVQVLLEDLQGEQGSGLSFVGSAESLLLLAISQYHPNERAYDELLDRVRELNEKHRLELAIAMSAMLGSHLRWGFPALYGCDLVRMRDDNVVDYPWLLFSIHTLLRHWAALHSEGQQSWRRKRVVEALVNGLTADPSAFLGTPPQSLQAHAREYREFCSLLVDCRGELWAEFEDCRPSPQLYSPLSFRINFPHNALVGMIALAISGREPGPANLSDLLAPGEDRERLAPLSESLARALMEFSSKPERLDTRGKVQILYDPENGLRNFLQTLEILG